MFLVIDIGVSFIKSAVTDCEKLFDIQRKISPTSHKFDINYIHETDPIHFLNIVKKIIDDYINKYSNIKGIFFSTQMHGFVIMESQEAKYPYYSWKNEFDKLKEYNVINHLNDTISSDIIKKTGMKLRSGLPSINMHIMAKDGKLKSSYSFCTIADYIVAMLTHNNIVTSLSNAAGSGLFDLTENDWNYELINALEINITLPKVIYNYNESIGKYRNIDIFIPIGDQQASVLGTVEEYKNIAISNIATGSQSTVIVDFLKYGDNYQTRPLLGECYLLTIPFLPAGRALNSIINFFDEIGKNIFKVENYDVWHSVSNFLNLNKNISSIQANIDFFYSLSSSGGSFSNITENNFTLNEFLNSVIDNLVKNHIVSLDILLQEISFDKIYLSGGIPIKIERIKTIFEEKYANKTILLAKEKEDALNGLKRLALRVTNEL